LNLENGGTVFLTNVGIYLKPEDGGNIFLRNVSIYFNPEDAGIWFLRNIDAHIMFLQNVGIKFKSDDGRLGFEVFTAVVMKSIIFCDITQCSPLRVNRRFGETYRLHLQGRRNKFRKKTCHLRVAA
jgi:hypothetical protein